ncbi:GIY-YIG domain-containing protein [Cephalotus follicularis]|uniref:GIY-YIG domain-containing protein n=1 Tax=Cephalotus follicularis TaxID=3775 RepID=A0A1Q3CIT9_CEPFO|nr:GIY-YIG domain-containing protein [Cephalotus follicularis]
MQIMKFKISKFPKKKKMMRGILSRTFRCVKHPKPHPNPNSSKSSQSPSNPPSSISISISKTPNAKPISISKSTSTSNSRSWYVYLILSTNRPIKTYVGVTIDIARRLKQHNGELKGGAKASRAGRPWAFACIIRGFSDQSEAYGFESKWKSFSRIIPRKRKNGDMDKHIDDGSLRLLQHRKAALDKIKASIDCGHLEIDWKLNPFLF